MLLSIVVNMYNTASFLPRCMDTLLNQDISPDSYEIILVDDGSTDNSLELALEYASKSQNDATMPHVKVKHHANKGLAGARNTGVDAAIGKYLCFVDPDDYIQENSLFALLHQMDNEELDILRFNYQKVDEQGNNLNDNPTEKLFDYSPKVMTGVEFMQNRMTTSCYVWAYIYRLDFIIANHIYFDESCYFDDVPWTPRVLQVAKRINCINIRHLYYTQRAGSLVHTVNIESIKRKVDGQVRLLEILHQHSINDNVLEWYKMMWSHIALSVLTTIAVYMYDKRDYYLNLIDQYQLYPLSRRQSASKSLWKIMAINFSPRFYMFMINLKTKLCYLR